MFDVKRESNYSQDIWRRYDLPNKTGATIARACTGDWIIFRETTRQAGTGAYFAVALIESVEPDPSRPGFFFAKMRDYLDFATPVPLMVGGLYHEQRIPITLRSFQIGPFFHGHPVREISVVEFDLISCKGFARTLKISNDKLLIAPEPLTGFAETSKTWIREPNLRRPQQVCAHRAFREANFRLKVCRRYHYKCAFTGLSISDRRGHHEVEAVHIWSVAEFGPDIVQNALCACRTFHWLFDHHFLTLDDALRPILAESGIPDVLLRLLPPPGEPIHHPHSLADWPQPTFLAHHRAAFAKKHGLEKV